jgi:rhodanese-related sulfurtransferase
MLLLLSLGLAIGFNMMNPKRIDWVKPQYERVEASQAELDRILGQSAETPAADAGSTVTTTPVATPATAPSTAPATAPATSSAGTTAKPVSAPQTTPAPAFEAEPGVIREIKLDAFKKLLNRATTYLIDARIPEKYAEGHVQGAVNVDGNTVEANIPQLLTIPRDRVIVIYCDGGHCELSHRVADVLKNFGYGPILIYTGGWAEWTGKGS